VLLPIKYFFERAGAGEISLLLADGLSFREIGKKLRISERNVQTHKNNILKKLGLRNTMQLVAWTVTNLK